PTSGNRARTVLRFGVAPDPVGVEMVRLAAPLGEGPPGERPLDHAPRHPTHATVLADLDLELHRLPIGIPAGGLGVKYIGSPNARRVERNTKSSLLGARVAAPPPADART